MNELYKEMIERYLEGDLTAEERIAFEQQLQQDPALAAELALHKKIHAEMQQHTLHEKKQQELNTTITSLNKEFFKQPAPVRRIKRWWYAAAGVAAAVVLLLVWNLFSGTESFDNKKLFAYYAKNPEELPGGERGGAADSLRLKAAALYNSQDYRNALPLLRTLTAANPEDKQLQMALAISLMHADLYAEAIRIFERIQTGSSVYMGEATWYKALTLLKQNNLSECYEVLEQIPETNSHYKQAAELMKKITKNDQP